MYFSKELLIQPYAPNTLIGEWTSAITTSINFKGSGIYEIVAVSGGGGGSRWDIGNSWHAYSRGGTGAYYNGLMRINAGTYTIKVGSGGNGGGSSMGGGGETSISSIFTLTGADSSYWQYNPPEKYYGGTGGNLINIVGETSRINYSAGNNGYHIASLEDNWWTVYSNLMSPANNYGLGAYGQGGGTHTSGSAATGSTGTNGYLKIVYKGAY